MSEQNKAIVRRLFNEVGSKGNMEVIPELITEDYVSHQLGAEDHKGYEGLEQLITMYRTAFPDMLITVDDQRSPRGTGLRLAGPLRARTRVSWLASPPPESR